MYFIKLLPRPLVQSLTVRFTLRLSLLCVGLSCLGIAVACAVDDEEIMLTIVPDLPYSVTEGDDIRILKALASGVGWEFTQDEHTEAGLKDLGIRYLRCINVDGPNIPGHFEQDGSDVRYVLDGQPVRLDKHFSTCRQIGATPHIILGARVPTALQVSAEDAEQLVAILGQNSTRQRPYWNGDWVRFRAYCKRVFRYTLIDNGFMNARFEVGNEPDIDGTFPRLVMDQGAMGGAIQYEMYLDLYRNISMAAREFEAENPGCTVTLGGPALSWAYTFRFGDFNWLEKFLSDASAEGLKLDFIGIHYYGNISSLTGKYESVYPPFVKMLKSAQNSRDLNFPDVPIIFTEWGPSYHVSDDPASVVNANHVGSAWSIAFLNVLLEKGIEQSLFLVTSDLALNDKSTGEWVNRWGWPSFFVSPRVFEKAWKKPMYNLFELITMLDGERVVLDGLGGDIGGIASRNAQSGVVTALLWNYGAELPEKEPPTKLGHEIYLDLYLDAPVEQNYTGRVWMISEQYSDAWSLYQREGVLDRRVELTLVDTFDVSGTDKSYGLALPICSVAFVEFTPLQNTPITEEASVEGITGKE